MATKFTHRRIRDEARDAHIALRTDYAPARAVPQRRIGLLTMGALTVCIVLLATLSRNGQWPLSGGPVQEGTARVIEKLLPADSASDGVLRLQILELDQCGPVETTVPREHWNALHVGDRVAVRYRTGRGGGAARVYDVAQAPLEESP